MTSSLPYLSDVPDALADREQWVCWETAERDGKETKVPLDPATGEATEVDLGGASLTNGDGILLDGRTLYVVRNRLNQIAVVELDETGGEPASNRVDLLLRAGALCNDATAEQGDPTEQALVEAAEEYGIDVEALREERPRTDEVPFSSEHKWMGTVHGDVGYVKGAPEVVLSKSSRVLTDDGPADLTPERAERVQEQVRAFADEALRVLAIAYTEDPENLEDDLVFVGLVGMIDPPRAEVADALAATQRAGIDVKMITGDNARTAAAIAGQLGLVAEDAAEQGVVWFEEPVSSDDLDGLRLVRDRAPAGLCRHRPAAGGRLRPRRGRLRADPRTPARRTASRRPRDLAGVATPRAWRGFGHRVVRRTPPRAASRRGRRRWQRWSRRGPSRGHGWPGAGRRSRDAFPGL